MASDAVLFGAVGDPDCDDCETAPAAGTGGAGLRKEMQTFANLRPAKAFAGLEKSVRV